MLASPPSLKRPVTIELDGEGFAAACETLAAAARDFQPDVVVGIATGGAHVAAEMVDHLDSPKLTIVSLQRPATRTKERLKAHRVLRRLPPRVADELRWLEVAMRERFLRKDAAQLLSPKSSHDFEDTVRGAGRVLVVDDTIDSGRTLSSVVEHVNAVAEAAVVRTAVVASTWTQPPVAADYCLHHRTLIRFPWSMDAVTA